MDTQAIIRHVDHTTLKATCTWEDIKKLCDEAVKYEMASVCIPPSYVKRANEAYGTSLNICTVVGFPLGYHTAETKVFEAKQAVAEGAGEIDVVVNLGDVKNNDFEKITAELKMVKEAIGDKVLKVIIETCYLTDDEKKKLCKCITDAKADYIKTSTGFGTAGAVLSDIDLFKENIGKDVKIKAAGGIRTKDDMVSFLESGCDRIGTSNAIGALVEN